MSFSLLLGGLTMNEDREITVDYIVDRIHYFLQTEPNDITLELHEETLMYVRDDTYRGSWTEMIDNFKVRLNRPGFNKRRVELRLDMNLMSWMEAYESRHNVKLEHPITTS